MAHEAHEEFPPLTPRAHTVIKAAQCSFPSTFIEGAGVDVGERRFAAAVIREAKRQAVRGEGPAWSNLDLIADNLHSPPPQPPSMAALRQAVQELENWERLNEVRPGDWIRERLSTVRRGIDHHLKS